MNRREYIKKMKADGFVSSNFLGYWRLPGTGTEVSDMNAGDDYGKKYSYMHKQLQKHRTS